ncbi:MAG: hypothetical protein MRY83_14665 [Flavobacteriales bacterium]|nr:hypothetical protein [Flavobacteriales bacterium]
MKTLSRVQFISHLITGLFHLVPAGLGIGLYIIGLASFFTDDSDLLGLVMIFLVPVVFILIYYFLLLVQGIRRLKPNFLARIKDLAIYRFSAISYIVTIVLTIIIGPLIFNELLVEFFRTLDLDFDFMIPSLTLQTASLLFTFLMINNTETI